MPGRVAIFIDGAYLEFVLRDEFQEARIDHQALSKCLAGDSDILRTYYYHCPVYQGNPPTKEESERYAAQRRFFTALRTLHGTLSASGAWPTEASTRPGVPGTNRSGLTFFWA